MPFIEILAPPIPAERRQEVATAVTDGICRSFSVGPETVTLYFLDIPPDAYAHAGTMGALPEEQRIFVKVHAYRRGTAERRAAAAAVTAPLAAIYGMQAAALAVYFFDRAKDEVAHAGLLSSDAEPA
jgi:phenylpyruvate tautomerase PptA (4-oxalocrotonate tautomerase family)